MDFSALLEMGNELGELSRLEQFLTEAAQHIGLDERTSYLLNLACDELVTNIILHGYSPEETGLRSILLAVRFASGGLELQLTDEGCAFDPLSKPAPDVTLSVEERGIGGLGIHFVIQIMDEVRYERSDGRNVLTMRKHRKDDAAKMGEKEA